MTMLQVDAVFRMMLSTPVSDLAIFQFSSSYCFMSLTETVLCMTSLPKNLSSGSPPSPEIIQVLLFSHCKVCS